MVQSHECSDVPITEVDAFLPINSLPFWVLEKAARSESL
jgi:hypothetical protein